MADVRAVFIALVVVFTLIVGAYVFTLFTGGYVKPFVDRLAPGENDAIGETEYLRISDRLYSTNRLILFIGIAMPIVGLVFYYLYSRQESLAGGFG